MKDLVSGVVIFLVVSLLFGGLSAQLSGCIADYHRARGERAVMEAAADAVRADTAVATSVAMAPITAMWCWSIAGVVALVAVACCAVYLVVHSVKAQRDFALPAPAPTTLLQPQLQRPELPHCARESALVLIADVCGEIGADDG